MQPLLIDNFAGGGGASTGIRAALGRDVDIAINHDLDAVNMHRVNHPRTLHFCENIFDVDPREVVQGRPVGLEWFSPDCRHFSKASGRAPNRDKKVRGLAWVVLRWAALTRPETIMLENVEEFATWGPLTRSRAPCRRRAGWTFEQWRSQLCDLGYRVEMRELRACDYGAPTIRNRLYIVATRDGRAVTWPEPTHGGDGQPPWRCAADIIDWSIPCPSIFMSPRKAKRLGIRRPLKPNTLARIAKGLERYVYGAADPFIIPITHAGDSRVHSIRDPLRTITTASRGEHALVVPWMVQHNTGMVGHDIRKPVSTIVQRGTTQMLATAWLSNLRGSNVGGGGDMRKPLRTITAGGNHVAAVQAFMIKYYGTALGQGVDEPFHSITPKARFGLVVIGGTEYRIVDIGMRMLTPCELYGAQGFPPDYVIDRNIWGTPFTKTAQTYMCGNSVPPDVAEALVRANCAHLAVDSSVSDNGALAHV